MTTVPRYRHACRACGRNMLSNPKCGLCGDCAAQAGKDRARSIEAVTAAVRDLELQLIVLDHKDLHDMHDQAEIARLRGLLLAQYRRGWEIVIGRKIVDVSGVGRGAAGGGGGGRARKGTEDK